MGSIIFFTVMGFLVLTGVEGKEERWRFPVRIFLSSLLLIMVAVLMGAFEPLWDYMEGVGALKLTGWNDKFKGYGG